MVAVGSGVPPSLSRGSVSAALPGKASWWPAAEAGGAQQLAAHQLLVLLAAGNPTRTGTIPDWRPVGPPG